MSLSVHMLQAIFVLLLFSFRLSSGFYVSSSLAFDRPCAVGGLCRLYADLTIKQQQADFGRMSQQQMRFTELPAYVNFPNVLVSCQDVLSRYTQQYSGHTYIEVLQLLHDVCVGYLSGCWVVCCQAWGSLKHMACSIPSMG